MKLTRIERILLACVAVWIADATLASSLNAQSGATASPAGKPELQLWQKREIEFFQTFKSCRTGDAEAVKAFDGILTEFDTHPMARTPMENMDVLGVFYVPKVFTTSAIPATFVISKAGEIAFQHVGAADWVSAEAVKYIETLRKEEPAHSTYPTLPPPAGPEQKP